MDYERVPIDRNDPLRRKSPDIQAFRKGPIKVLLSTDVFDFYRDGKSKACIHLSISHSNRYPTWQEIKDARYRLMPRDRDVFQVLPPPDDYCNVHPNCFHLWCPILEMKK